MLKGRKIILRQQTEQDAEILQKWYMDKDFRQMYDAYVSVSLDMIIDELKDQQSIFDPNAKQVNFMVLNKRDNTPIGVATIKDIDRQNGHAEIALGIANKEQRLSGFGIDILIVLLDFVFYDCGFEKCYLKVNDNNVLGFKSTTSFGFKKEGRLRHHTFIDGKYVDLWILGILKDEYEQLSIVPRWKARK